MLNGKESLEVIKDKIRKAINDGRIRVKKDTAYFRWKSCWWNIYAVTRGYGKFYT